MKSILKLLLCIPLVLWIGWRWHKSAEFDSATEASLKSSLDLADVEKAEQHLDAVLNYLEQKHLTSGNTSVASSDSRDDLGLWYKTLKVYREQLDRLKKDAAVHKQLTDLMATRSALIDRSQSPVVGLIPSGISVFPSNRQYAIIGWAAVLAFMFGIILYRWY
jgi:hypothetical protein